MGMTRREAIEALEYLISDECTDTQMDYVAEIQMAINDMKTCEANNPRVLMLEEVRSKQIKAIPIWKETKSKNKALYVGWVLAYEVQTGQGITGDCLGMAEPTGRMVWYKLGDYGKTWRVWSAKPTDEERKKVDWE